MSVTQPTTYRLPSSPSLQVEDRFDILSRDDESTVPFWDILTCLLAQEVTSTKALIDTLETIAVTLQGKSNTDYGSLRSFKISAEFYTRIWPVVRDIALQMPILFPTHNLSILSPEHPRIELSRRQVSCLVIHQFLCTLAAPVWQHGYQDFHIWYGSEQPHSSAVEAYTTALFAYFERIASDELIEWPIVYSLTEDSSEVTGSKDGLGDFQVLFLPQASTTPDVLGLPNGAAVISANKFVGFGSTGTQEEVHVGASPETCPVVLVTPPLTDRQVLTVTGPEAMISIIGYGRNARVGEILKQSTIGDTHRSLWFQRTMLFMDAMELDMADQSLGMPVDLQTGNVERDLRKAVTAFRACRLSPRSESQSSIFTGFWGCRTFGGHPEIKSCIQWAAASKAGCNIIFICSGQEQEDFGHRLEHFVARVRSLDLKWEVLAQCLMDLKPKDVRLDDTPFQTILRRLEDNA